MKEKIKDVVIRAFKTFWQAGLAYFCTSAAAQLANSEVDIDYAKKILTGLLLGAVAAGLSAVWNSVIGPLCFKEANKYKTTDNTEDE